MAQPAGADGDNFLYRTKAGDTLMALSQTYTDNTGNWQTLESINRIKDQFSVPIGYLLKIPFSLIPVLPSQATVSHLAGLVYENDVPLSPGAKIDEGSTLRTGPDGFATLSLADGSHISVPSLSILKISRLRTFKNTGLIDAVLSLDEGSLEAQVAPQQTGVGRFEIRAPVSVTGVRGTQLRVRVSPQGNQTELISGVAQLATKQNNQAKLTANKGAAVDTQGRLLSVRPLLPAPVLSEPVRGGRGWEMTVQPDGPAVAYLVRVSQDEQGENLVYSKLFDTPNVSFNGRTSGQHYVFVRSVDKDGIMGLDATRAFESIVGLQTASGGSVLTSFGEPVLLTDY